MADKRFLDENDNRKFSVDDDYIEIIDDSDNDIFSSSIPDVIELEPDDIFSASSKDVYIGKKKQQEADNNVYFTKRSTPEQASVRRTAPQPVQRPVQRPQQTQQRAVQRAQAPAPKQQAPVQRRQQPTPEQVRQQQLRERQRVQQQANMRAANSRSNTQKIRVIDSEEISDFEARRKNAQPKGGAARKTSPAVKVLVVLLAVIIGFGAIAFVMAGSVVGKFNKADPIEHIDDVSSLRSEAHVRNILLIGADADRGGSSRSDSIMIASVNKQTGRITVCSILRDTHLDVPGHQESKVNAAYSWGGANLLIQTIEQNFGIKIDDYAVVNFDMFTALIDGLGGIELDVTEDEADYINNRHKYGKEEKPEEVPYGEGVRLSGYQALWYSRIRKLGNGDWDRTERQRKVISAIMKDVKGQLNPVGVFGLVSTAQEVAPYITTTLSTNDFWSLMFSMMSCMTKTGGNMDKLLVTQQIPFEDTWWYSSQWDGSSISLDLEANRDKLQTLLYEDYEISEETEASTAE
ncbi:MAG: LCP family protein [Clostridia bacterium]|nr:LCP family protein [Clostridia bacterium]